MSATYNTRDRIANIGAGMVPTYHATESVDEANAVVEQCATATERLRELLDERGVEYEGGERSMRWRDRYGIMMQAFPLANGELGMEVWSCTPEQAIAATLGGDNSDTVKRLMKLQGGHYGWPMLYEAVTGDPFDYGCSPSKSEEVFIKKLISIVGGRKVVDE